MRQRERDSSSVCVLVAHLAYLCRNTPAASLDFQKVSTVLVAQGAACTDLTVPAHTCACDRHVSHRPGLTVRASPSAFLANFFPWDVDASSKDANKKGGPAAANTSLLFPQTEILSLFQAQRLSIITWIEAHPRLAAEVFEAVERVLSYTGVRRRAQTDSVARSWVKLRDGVYMPETE